MPLSPPNSQTSTLTVQNLIDYARLFSGTSAGIGVAGYSDEPAVSFADDVMKKIMAKSNPWKWNAQQVPPFLTQPYQQDYPTNISQNTMGWLQSAVILDVNSTSAPRVVPPITAVQNLLPTFFCDVPKKICWIPNALAQTAVWGRGLQTDPGPGSVYMNPLSAVSGGGPGTNPIATVTDPNGNIQVVTTYGVCGNSQPSWPASSAPIGFQTGDGTVVWTVQDPNGVAFRLDSLATFNSNVWEVHALYQVKPPNVKSLSQTMSPIPDDLSYLVKQGFLAYCRKAGDSAAFLAEYEQWTAAIQEAMGASDREQNEFGMFPANPIQESGTTDGVTGGWAYAGWSGWS